MESWFFEIGEGWVSVEKTREGSMYYGSNCYSYYGCGLIESFIYRAIHGAVGNVVYQEYEGFVLILLIFHL